MGNERMMVIRSIELVARYIIATLLGFIALLFCSGIQSLAFGQNPRAGFHIEKGMFLVARPALQDPNFRKTVVLICEHSDEGTLGLVVNRPSRILLSEALPDVSILKGTTYTIFRGGPVQPNAILMLFRLVDEPTEGRPILNGVYLGGPPEILERVIRRPQPTETFRAYAGYTGWAPGQLEFEIATGAWDTVPGDPSVIFDKDPDDLWDDLLRTPAAPRVIFFSVIPSKSRP
jgi:putative transcriptional regulator